MKIQIKPYLKFILIQNTAYVIITFTLIALIFTIPSFLINKYTENKEKINNLTEELNDMRSKRNALIFLSSLKTQNLDDYYNLMMSLIPESENYFSILFALDELSQSTNFVITSYKITPVQSSENRISIQVRGEGNHNDFLDFLKQYNISSGRLITAEKINLDNTEFTGIQLNLSFYNKKSSLYQSSKVDYQKILARLDKIRNKVKFNIQKEEASQKIVDYEVKSNPF